MSLKRMAALILFAVMLGSVIATTAAQAATSTVSPCYTNTHSIYASLNIAGGTASCFGKVSPYGEKSCSIIVTLYKKAGSNWKYVASWSASAKNGSRATASGTANISKGTYKVVSVGYVDGERTEAETAEKTY